MNIFWNRSERRLRALWRILLQSIVMFFLSGIMSFAVILGMFFVPGGAGTVLNRTDMYHALLNYFMINPYASLIIMLASFLVIFVSIRLAARILDHRPFAAFGFHFNRQWWLDFLFGLGLGAVLMTIIFTIEWGIGWVIILPENEPIGTSLFILMLIGLVKFILVGIQEELISRGYHLVNLAEGLNLPTIGRRTAAWLAFFLSSVVFGLLHLGNPHVSIASILNLCIAGVLLGLPYLLTGELALSIGVHITWNYFQGFIYGFPVSGIPTSNSLILIQQSGPSLMTGGAFGPEGGLVSVIVMALGIGLSILWVRATRGRLSLNERIGVYTTRKPQAISNEQLPE